MDSIKIDNLVGSLESKLQSAKVAVAAAWETCQDYKGLVAIPIAISVGLLAYHLSQASAQGPQKLADSFPRYEPALALTQEASANTTNPSTTYLPKNVADNLDQDLLARL